MDELGIDIQVLSVLPPLFRYELPSRIAIPAARDINDDIAELCRSRPDRFLGLATLPLQDVDAALAEIERALGDLGLIGVEIGTFVRERNLDDPALIPVFEALAKRNAFVFCHPSIARGGTTMRSYYLQNLIGNPWETAIAMASLMFGGPLEQFQNLKICFAHGGGYGPFGLGRLQHGYEFRKETRVIATTPPRTLIRGVYVDALVHDDRAVKYLLDTVGPDNVLLGSDFPADMGPRDPVGEIDRSQILSGVEKLAVRGGNAARLLRALGHLR